MGKDKRAKEGQNIVSKSINTSGIVSSGDNR